MVDFQPGTASADAKKVLAVCARQNSVVISVGPVRELNGGFGRAFVYTRSIGDTGRVGALLKCLRASGMTQGVGFGG